MKVSLEYDLDEEEMLQYLDWAIESLVSVYESKIRCLLSKDLNPRQMKDFLLEVKESASIESYLVHKIQDKGELS